MRATEEAKAMAILAACRRVWPDTPAWDALSEATREGWRRVGAILRERAAVCPTHPGVKLYCPACAGVRGGSARSPAKTAANRANIRRRWARPDTAAEGEEPVCSNP